ncbi:hypothetical protein SAMN04488519_106329 [Algoriphagus ornithinivorans]|uniref:DoxX protein n=1 Tax=Algoriphagus ornithinivorans TaxID=226506 RepID=A0A1I5H7F7_9BACT|nr:hypothetical protein [Algoriphagus ornithinivorans]SFO44123.1 hypothetical protein SAMN04488519_106329 [Algoriphagus ornithinivorans]
MNHLASLGRVSLFIIYFWFGILKVIGISPAEPLVENLFNQLLGGIIPFEIFNQAFGLGECLIGICWLFPKISKVALLVLLGHMISTFLPVIFLPNETWQTWFTPTLVGQYIIKNLALISLALMINQEQTRRLIIKGPKELGENYIAERVKNKYVA